MNSRHLPWLTVVMVLLVGTGALFTATRGFRAVTSDRARQLTLADSPRALPALPLITSDGRSSNLVAEVGHERYTIVSLVYTRCTSMCLLSASSGAFLQGRIREQRLRDSVRVLTLSFDPGNDTPEVLSAYAERMRADPTIWTVATVTDPSSLRPLLDVFGVVVLPDGQGGYVHNGALFIIDPGGRLIDALDPEAADASLKYVLGRLRP